MIVSLRAFIAAGGSPAAFTLCHGAANAETKVVSIHRSSVDAPVSVEMLEKDAVPEVFQVLM